MFQLILKSSGWCNLHCPEPNVEKAAKRLVELGAKNVKEDGTIIRFRAKKELVEYLTERLQQGRGTVVAA